MLICVVGSLVLCRGASGIARDTSSDEYRAIARRNAFGLKSPEPPAAAAAEVSQMPKLILTGITTILGDRRALLKLLPSAVKPGEQAKEQSLILKEGQREGGVELLKVDENAGTVKVNNSGTIMTLTFDKDGAKLPSTPAPPPAPSPAPLPLMNPAVPGGLLSPAASPTNLYSVPGPGNMNTGRHVLPTRNPRLPVPGVTAAPDAAGTTPSVAGQAPPPTGQGPLPAGQAAAPAAQTPLPTQQVPAAAAQPQSDLTPQQQLLLLELEQEVNGNNQNNNNNQGNAPSSPGPATPAVPGGTTFPGGNSQRMLPPGATVPGTGNAGAVNPGAGNPPNLLPLMPQ